MASRKKIAIYGAGGFAREVAWLLSTHESYGVYEVVGYIEDDAEHGRILNGKPVLSWQSFSAATGPPPPPPPTRAIRSLQWQLAAHKPVERSQQNALKQAFTLQH